MAPPEHKASAAGLGMRNTPSLGSEEGTSGQGKAHRLAIFLILGMACAAGSQAPV